jgi:hypothetical protein
MNELIESGDPRAKVVGRRRMPQPGVESLEAAGKLIRACSRLRPKPFRVRRGVYRFMTHEAADEWMMNLQILR